MSRITPIKWKDFEQFLFFIGCTFVNQTGSHRKYRKAGLARSVIVPAHNKPLSLTVIKSNLKTLGLSTEEYLDILSRL